MKKFGFWAAYLFIVLLGALLLTEILAHLLLRDESYVVHPLSEFEHDPTLGWKGIPGFRGKTPLTNSDIEINEHGFRDGNWEEKLKQSQERGMPRFLFIGDSCTYGYEIPVSARLGEQLAHIYNRNGRQVTIFNAGIPAWGTSEEFRALQELLPILDPQFVFLQYSTNDFGDSCLPYCYSDPKFRVYRPYYDVDGKLVLNKFVPKRFSLRVQGTLLERLRLKFFVDRLEALLDDIHYSRFAVSENRRVPVDSRTPDNIGFDRHVWDMGAVGYHPAFQDIYEKNKQRNLVLWKQISELCRARGTEFFTLIPSSGNADSPPAEKDTVDFF
ncbi:MAG: hypothetical protein QG577_1166, partial [Thermodesulfobacteriota bacterium]|nr:hypothetical protein [Thermodesulfobacteriota bacterium]